MGDHYSWQKESYIEQSTHIPFLLSWPVKYKGDIRNNDLVCLTDLFAIATAASGESEPRDGKDIIGVLDNNVLPRGFLFASYGRPGTAQFKFMVINSVYKYIFISNGSRLQLFNLKNDPNELTNLANVELEKVQELHTIAINYAFRPGLFAAFEGNDFKTFPYKERPQYRINQMAYDRGISNFTVK